MTGGDLSILRSLEANVAAYDSLRERLRVGMTEQDAYRLVSEAVNRVCGDEAHEFIGDFVGGVRTGAIEGPPTELVLREGDLFICDLSVRRGETWSDTCRTFFLGEPTAEQRRAYDAVLQVQRIGEELVRAGTVCEDVKSQAEARLVSLGFGGKMPHHVGHRVGPQPYLKPAFEFGDRTPIELGWCMTLEPGLYFENAWGMRVENDYLVTEDGLENLFNYPKVIEHFIIKG